MEDQMTSNETDVAAGWFLPLLRGGIDEMGH